MRIKLHLLVLASFVISVNLWAADDPMTGTWKLNLAESKYNPGPLPGGSTIVKIEISGDAEKNESQGFDAQGKPTTLTRYIAKFDGKEHPQTGSQTVDTVVLKRIDPYSVARINKKDGKIVSILTRVVSKDGKVFRGTTIGINAEGQPYHNVTVFEKQ